MGMEPPTHRDPLHGVTLERVVTELQALSLIHI